MTESEQELPLHPAAPVLFASDHPAGAVPAPPPTLRDLVTHLRRDGERVALWAVHGDTPDCITFADLSRQALALAGGMVSQGLKPQEPVVLFGPNSIAWVVVRLALAAAGAVTVALDDLTTDAELSRLLPDCGAGRAFCAGAHLPRLKFLPEAQGLALWRLDRPTTADDAPDAVPHWSALLPTTRPPPLPPLDPDAPQMQVYTSGTTGTPKSFVLSHANLLHNIDALVAEAVVGREDRVLLPLPLHHVYPLTVGLLASLAGGTTVVFPESVTGPHLVKALQSADVTAMVAVPRLYAALLAGLEARVAARGPGARRLFGILVALAWHIRRRFGIRIGKRLFASLHRQLAPQLWLMASGGARFEAPLIWRLEALGWDVRSGWGLAETASILTRNGDGRDKKIGTEGRPLPGMALRVFEPDDSGTGELQARGPSLFRGYRNNPEATAAAFTADGWFRTGDLGSIDHQGFVTIAGRVKEMIVLGGGKNVFPEELEKTYGASPYIRELAILEDKGALVALVVPNLEAIAAAGNLNPDDAVRVTLTEIGQTLPGFQRLTGYALTREPLPRTMLGKYRRFLLPDLFRLARTGRSAKTDQPIGPDERRLLESPHGRSLWLWLGERFPQHAIRLDTSLQLDLAIDSLEWMTMTLEMAERFDLAFTEDDIGTLFTVRDLLQRAADRGAAERQPDGGSTGRGGSEAGADRGAIPPASPEQQRWLEPPGLGDRLAARVLYGINLAVMRGLLHLTAQGVETVPHAGPCLIACNHVSDLDAQVLIAALGWGRVQQVWWAGDEGRLFGTAIGRRLARIGHIFPASQRNPTSTLSGAVAVLRRGQILAWFPESWRSPTGELQRFLPGIGHLVLATGVPVIPARVFGTFEVMPRNRRLPRLHPVAVRFGPALAGDSLQALDSAAAIADRVRDAVAALQDPRD